MLKSPKKTLFFVLDYFFSKDCLNFVKFGNIHFWMSGNGANNNIGFFGVDYFSKSRF